MKNRFLILFVVAATLFACSSDSMNTEDSMDLSKRSKDKTISFKITDLEGNYTLSGSASCPGILNANGQETVPHLGLSTVFEEWCFNPLIENDLGTRSITITAANGDELYGYHTTILWTSPTTFEETLVIDGGSGRFENACGTFMEYVEISPISPVEGTFVLNIEQGTLTFTDDCEE